MIMGETSVAALIECCIRNSHDGKINFSELISQASTNRRKITSNELERCVKENSDRFDVTASGWITMKSEEQRHKEMLEMAEADLPSNKSPLPKSIAKGQGCVIQIKGTWGLIAMKEPVKHCKTSFNSACFGEKFKFKSLQEDLNIEIGSKVCFNAELNDRGNQYKCSKVWKSNEKGQIIHPEGVKWRKKTLEDGRFDPHRIESWGIVQKIFENLGFISVEGDDSNTVFFHKNFVQNVKNIIDLRHVINVGDKIEFKAKRTHRKDSKARWDAEEVLVVKQETRAYINTKSYKSNASGQNRPQPTETQFLAGTEGNLFPSCEGTIIKFQLNDSPAVANVIGCPIYLNGSVVSDINWELEKGEKVKFDAKSIEKAPWWTATLVWIGIRPKNEPPSPRVNKPQNTNKVTQEKSTDRNDHGTRKPKYQISSSQYAAKFTKLTKQSRPPKQKPIPPRPQRLNDSEESLESMNSNSNDTRSPSPYSSPFELNRTDWAESPYLDEKDLDTDISVKSKQVYIRNISESLSIDSGQYSESAEEQENSEFYNNEMKFEGQFQQYSLLDVRARISDMDINENACQKRSRAVDPNKEANSSDAETHWANDFGYDAVQNGLSAGKPSQASVYASDLSWSNEATDKRVYSHTTTALCKSTSSDKQKPPVKFLHAKEDSYNMELPKPDSIEDFPAGNGYHFQHVKDELGTVINLTVASAELKFKDFEKPCKFFLWNLFIDGVVASKLHKDLRKAINKECYLKFNYTRHLPTNENMIAMVWIGDKPNRAFEKTAFERCELLFNRTENKPEFSMPINDSLSSKQMPMPISGANRNINENVDTKSAKAISYAKLVGVVQPILDKELPHKENSCKRSPRKGEFKNKCH